MSMSREQRDHVARSAYAALGSSPTEKMTLQVVCGRSHRLASVYATGDGMVYRSVVKSTSHGDRDQYDGGHKGARQGTDWYDLLDAGVGPAVDDALPAGCECGPYTLSRTDLLNDVAHRRKKVIVD